MKVDKPVWLNEGRIVTRESSATCHVHKYDDKVYEFTINSQTMRKEAIKELSIALMHLALWMEQNHDH